MIVSQRQTLKPTKVFHKSVNTKWCNCTKDDLTSHPFGALILSCYYYYSCYKTYIVYYLQYMLL